MSANAPASLRSARASVVNKSCGRHDLVGARRQVEQCAVDVEKKSERSVAQRRHITWPRALYARRVELVHPQLLTPLRPT